MATKATTSTEEQYYAVLASNNISPLWIVLSKMVPPRPNPTAKVTSWRDESIRPLLMESGTLISAEEAERRILMLVNSTLGARSLHYGLHLRRAAAHLARRDGTRTPARRFRAAFHCRGLARLHGRRGPKADDGTGGCDPDAELALARPRQRGDEPNGVARRAGPAGVPLLARQLCRKLRRSEVSQHPG
ncbi:hypothetical protein VTG60DRAFT_1097 [Thermothelomyces hinnuleus]